MSIKEKTFTDWLVSQMPPGTVISNPSWWATRIMSYHNMYLGEKQKPADDQLEKVFSVLDRYQDARVFTNLQTRQIARSIEQEIKKELGIKVAPPDPYEALVIAARHLNINNLRTSHSKDAHIIENALRNGPQRPDSEFHLGMYVVYTNPLDADYSGVIVEVTHPHYIVRLDSGSCVKAHKDYLRPLELKS